MYDNFGLRVCVIRSSDNTVIVHAYCLFAEAGCMDDYTKKDLEEAHRTMVSMIARVEKVKVQFAPGTAHHTLQCNRLKALNIALSLISNELSEINLEEDYIEKDMEKVLSPIASLISKSVKAQKKLDQSTWQYAMMSHNINALHIASSLFLKKMSGISIEKSK
jgi:hypothetical protein